MKLTSARATALGAGGVVVYGLANGATLPDTPLGWAAFAAAIAQFVIGLLMRK